MMPEVGFSSEGQLSLITLVNVNVGLKQRKSLEDKESKTKVCQYLYKKIQLPLEGLSLEWIDTLEQE